MLEQRGIRYRYREYTQSPLSAKEIREILDKLGLEPRRVLRRHDRTSKELRLTGKEPPERLIDLMAQHPTLLQRPIGVLRGRAVVGRPPERLLELFEDAHASP